MTPSSITWSALPVVRDRVNSAWINGRYDCYLYDSGTLDIELVVQSVYADTYVKMTTYNIHVDTPRTWRLRRIICCGSMWWDLRKRNIIIDGQLRYRKGIIGYVERKK